MENEIIEKCAVAVWNLWGKEPFPMENTDRIRAFDQAITAIRALKENTK